MICDRVCRHCNSALGEMVDTHLTNHPLIVVQRAILGLAGNSGKIPDPFKALFGEGTLRGSNGRRVRAYSAPGGKMIAHLLHHVQEFVGEDGLRYRTTSVDMRDAKQLPTIITRQRARDGAPSLNEAEMATTVAGILADREIIHKPTVEGDTKIDFKMYRLGVLKIAYELAFRWIGERFLDSDPALQLRDLITGQTEYELDDPKRVVRLRLNRLSRLWPGNDHLALCMRASGRLVMVIRIFRIISAVIDLGDAELLEGPRFLRMDPQRGRFTDTPLGPELFRRDRANFRTALDRCSSLRRVIMPSRVAL